MKTSNPILNDIKTLKKLKEVSLEDEDTFIIDDSINSSSFDEKIKEKKSLKEIIKKTWDQIFPPKCYICNRKNDKSETSNICDDCRNIFTQYEVDKTFYDDNKKEIGFGIYRYDGTVRFIIQKMKFKKDSKVATVLGDISISKAKEFVKKHHINYIMPIPMSNERLKERGFNQAEIIAKILAESLGIVFRNDIIIRSKCTIPQSKLSFEERKENVKNSFKILIDLELKGKDILLVDDIYTTGSTIEECSKVLYEHNTRKVYFLSISVSNNNLKGEVNNEN